MNCFVHFFQIGKDLYYFVYSYSTLSLFRISYINRASCCTFFFQPTTVNQQLYPHTTEVACFRTL